MYAYTDRSRREDFIQYLGITSTFGEDLKYSSNVVFPLPMFPSTAIWGHNEIHCFQLLHEQYVRNTSTSANTLFHTLQNKKTKKQHKNPWVKGSYSCIWLRSGLWKKGIHLQAQIHYPQDPLWYKSNGLFCHTFSYEITSLIKLLELCKISNSHRQKFTSYTIFVGMWAEALLQWCWFHRINFGVKLYKNKKVLPWTTLSLLL